MTTFFEGLEISLIATEITYLITPMWTLYLKIEFIKFVRKNVCSIS